ncbi:hypothetical protein EDB85DRAFT_1918472 [Lactarius pseudohatsudake]|nr:hypothetical protein EDB85DRAFT_1918472 [Lactarius pseudohatsudake]
MESHDDTALARQKSDVRYRMLEIEKRSAEWRSEEYRKLLQQFCGDVGQSAAQPEGGRPVNNSLSRSAPVTPSGPTPQQQVPVPSSLVVREDNDDRRSRRQGTSREFVPPRRIGRCLLVPSPQLCADNGPSNRSAIFGAAGLFDRRLTPLEAAWAIKTPNIPWLAFTRTFGGSLFLCTNKVSQPFAPRHVGEPGVILFPPGMVLLENTKETFHVLVDPSMGRRTELRLTEWHALPTLVSSFSTLLSWFLSHGDVAQCRSIWFRRIRKSVAAMSDVQARCSLRETLGSEPSPAEIQEWLRNYNDGIVTMGRNVIPNGFNSGAEKFGFEVIKCVGYDVKLAKLIRNNANR